MRAILTWHSIDPSGSPISVDEAAFARHVEFLASGRVRAVPLESILSVPESEDAVALTFDDGFRNFADVAWPRLRDAGLPATVFVVSGRAGGDNRWGDADEPGIPRLPLMDWDTLARLAAEGVSLGSHSRTHRSLPSLAPEEVAGELVRSREEIRSRTGAEARTFAYPFGDVDAATAAAAAREYRAACTVAFREIRRGDAASLLPRLDAYYFRRPGTLESFGSGRFRAYVRARAALRAVRARVRGVARRRGAPPSPAAGASARAILGPRP